MNIAGVSGVTRLGAGPMSASNFRLQNVATADGKEVIFMLLYVDDILITGSKPSLIS